MSGESVGYSYPEVPGQLTLMGPIKVADYLTPEKQDFQPLPYLMDPLDGVLGLDELQRGLIKANHETNLVAPRGYFQRVSTEYSNLYNRTKDFSLKIDNLSRANFIFFII